MNNKIEIFLKKLNYDEKQLEKISNYEIDFIFEKAKEEKFNKEETLEMARLIANCRKRWYKNEYTLDEEIINKKKAKKLIYIPENIKFNSINEAVKYFKTTFWKLKKEMKNNNNFKYI